MAHKKILVVDDSNFILNFTSDALSTAGYEIETSDNIFIAPVVNQFQPDLILMDVNVSTQKGTVAVEVLKKHTFAKNSKIYLYSIKLEDELQLLAKSCGADGYISKTKDAAELRDTVRAILAQPTTKQAA